MKTQITKQMDDDLSLNCSCGCGFKTGSNEFYLLHVGTAEELEHQALLKEAYEHEQTQMEMNF